MNYLFPHSATLGGGSDGGSDGGGGTGGRRVNYGYIGGRGGGDIGTLARPSARDDDDADDETPGGHVN
tara:strand:+ start:173 stop:376 length:204 start_codon:yes stop_codon:yes gene_type:complete